MLEFKLNGDEGVRQGRIGVNSDGFLRYWTRGVSTPDLASACVLCPLNCLVLDFKTGGLMEMNEQRSGVYQTGNRRGDYSKGWS